MMSRNLFACEPLQGDNVMNYDEQEQTRDSGLLPTQREQHTKTPPQLAPYIPSHYVDTDLRRYVLLDENRNSQEFGSSIPNTPNTVGTPVTAHELRRRVNALDNAVYSPTIVNGSLQFVCMNNSDTRSAKSSTAVDNNVCSEIYQ
ncbi:hypothetical protein ANCCAN_15667 [Ancylostoma caninum]|uniref:Uncharacterized protein n=1 Tax=Ancylostoma caninum TaxID=29170 RepID=A0A368G6X4_ANCCA|nr:hypothetical protein ANCCAN_15667 [Ancylostoma caninum]